jgi:hypothetical protein
MSSQSGDNSKFYSTFGKKRGNNRRKKPPAKSTPATTRSKAKALTVAATLPPAASTSSRASTSKSKKSKSKEGDEDDWGLSELQKAHLLVDCEANPTFQFQHIVKLNRDYYRSDYVAFCNRFYYQKAIRARSSTEYFNLIGEAHKQIESAKKKDKPDPYYGPVVQHNEDEDDVVEEEDKEGDLKDQKEEPPKEVPEQPNDAAEEKSKAARSAQEDSETNKIEHSSSTAKSKHRMPPKTPPKIKQVTSVPRTPPKSHHHVKFNRRKCWSCLSIIRKEHSWLPRPHSTLHSLSVLHS